MIIRFTFVIGNIMFLSNWLTHFFFSFSSNARPADNDKPLLLDAASTRTNPSSLRSIAVTRIKDNWCMWEPLCYNCRFPMSDQLHVPARPSRNNIIKPMHNLCDSGYTYCVTNSLCPWFNWRVVMNERSLITLSSSAHSQRIQNNRS